MHIGLRIFFGFFLIVGLAAFLTLRVFVQEVKPGVRQAMEDTLVDTANVLAVLATEDMKQGHIANGAFARRLAKLRNASTAAPTEANIWGLAKRDLGYRVYITDAKGIVRFDTAGTGVGSDYSKWNDVYLTLQGKYGARSTRAIEGDDSSTVMHVAAPIRDGDRIIGALTVAKPNLAMAPFIERSQRKILLHGLLLMGVAFAIGIGCTLWLVHGLRKLQRYARAVAVGERAEMPLQGANELAELGRAVETMRLRLEDKQYVEHYIHTLTHEMKSPLAAIGGAAELLQEDMPAADRGRFVTNIQRQTQRLEQMIGKLLALASVEQRQRLETREPVALVPLLGQLLRELEPRARQRALTFSLRPGDDAASVQTALSVQGDPFLLRQACANLIENALDFAPSGSTIDITVTQAGDTESRALVVEVGDRGPGIPDYALPRLFERFYSLPRPEGRDKSTGLGLCFVREVAMLHHGAIVLANRSDGGTLATLTLPTTG